MLNEIVKKITRDLLRLGIEPGDTVLVHASLRSLGSFENRAPSMIDALLEALGPAGTLLMPALSYETVTRDMQVFNQKHTPSCVGGLAEYFRKLPQTKRSIHPTHSVCAAGRHTGFLIGNHHVDTTPCGPNSPFRKLETLDGKIMFLGCGLEPNTSMHGIEELVKPTYLFGAPLEYRIEPENANSYKKEYVTHSFEGFEQRYDRILEVLSPTDYSTGKVLRADAYLLPTKPLWEKAYQKMLKESLFFVDQANGEDSYT